ncbi:hypothetical protein NDU88_005402 [Pleurodeles waltl]|uniref:Secreted protein n=1 Tax=Pleurodeles waltl TaxID=8319 RepID=A0AAV7PF97_PLEWA|nr:hypothetical protein NDU88_005402 [Pleurodeles waltl]
MAAFSAVLLFPDFGDFFCPFNTLGGVTADSALPPGPLRAVFPPGVFTLSRRPLSNLRCFTGGGLAVLWLRVTVAALVAGALHTPLTRTTGTRLFLAEVLLRDL